MNWAMDQATGDPRSQCLLYVIADCANPEGIAWPSVKYMASKSQQSKATVQRRLKELEELGAIARFPRWEDDDGKINSEGRGRRTSDEVRCLMDVRIDRKRDDEEAESDDTPVSASDGGVSASDGGIAQLSDGPPSHCGNPHMNRNTEPKDSPLPPKGEAGEADQENWTHEASWQRVEQAWGDPILHQRQCRQLWSAFTEPERERFLRVIRGYLAWRLAQPKLPLRVNIQKLMRELDSWPGYERLAGPDPSLRVFVVEGSADARALEVMALIGGYKTRPSIFDDTQGQRGYWKPRPLEPDERALAQFLDKPQAQWTPLDRGDEPFNAWADRMKQWTGVWPQRLLVPCLYPPLKNGSLSKATDPPPQAKSA